MKIPQKYSPKYWVGHNKSTDDVLLHTARKCKYEVQEIMDEHYEGWWEDDSFEITLIEIRVVKEE